MAEWLLIYKIAFLIILLLVSFSLITWKLKSLPSYLRKPLVLIIYPFSIIPLIFVSLTGKLYTKAFWQYIKNNFKIAWDGHLNANH